ncbi:MAG: S8 family serine peptidase [Elusimicrobiota bacterium]|nr:S8 family serine peptidase [Elusimicrobiota bacterium]
MRTPLLVLAVAVMLAASPASRAEDAPAPPQPVEPAPPTRLLPVEPPPPPEPGGVMVLPGMTIVGPARRPTVSPTPDMAEKLRAAGWRAREDGGFERLDGRPPQLYATLVERMQFVWKGGVLHYKGSLTPVEDDKLGPILEGMTPFAKAMSEDARAAGGALAAWGVPQVYDGRRLIEADGSASYLGLMLHQFYATNAGALARLGGERLSGALDLFETAFQQAFIQQSPDLGQRDIARAWGLLAARVRSGEATFTLQPYGDPGAALAGYRTQLEAEVKAAAAAAAPGDDDLRGAEAQVALAALNALERRRGGLTLPAVPAPGAAAPSDDAAVEGEASAVGDEGARAGGPFSSALPIVLRVLDRINGTPLTREQQRALIESFPMGELVWRTGVHEQWRRGITGTGVRVAVVDTGIAPHPELDGAVVSRQNFTLQRGGATVGDHGTHVAGVIHALAPDAEIRSYVALAEGNARQEEPDNDGQVIAAIRRAVADGNQIINLSLGGRGHASDAMVRVIEELSGRGVLFVIAAGNEGTGAGGVASPAVAPSAIVVANADARGRMALSSSRGVNWDPVRMSYAARDLFMAPGTNIYSTTQAGYDTMSGTSMATPTVAAVSALLWQQVSGFTPVPGPLATAGRVRDALAQGPEATMRELPTDFDLDQSVRVVNAGAAFDYLAEPQPVATK